MGAMETSASIMRNPVTLILSGLLLLAGCAASGERAEPGECAPDETRMKDGNTGLYYCASKWEHEATLRIFEDDS